MSRHRERTTVNDLMTEFDIGNKVVIDINSSYQKAMPHPRFQGKPGVVMAKRGDAYEVEIEDGDKKKILVAGVAHLKAA